MSSDVLERAAELTGQTQLLSPPGPIGPKNLPPEEEDEADEVEEPDPATVEPEAEPLKAPAWAEGHAPVTEQPPPGVDPDPSPVQDPVATATLPEHPPTVQPVTPPEPVEQPVSDEALKVGLRRRFNTAPNWMIYGSLGAISLTVLGAILLVRFFAGGSDPAVVPQPGTVTLTEADTAAILNEGAPAAPVQQVPELSCARFGVPLVGDECIGWLAEVQIEAAELVGHLQDGFMFPLDPVAAQAIGLEETVYVDESGEPISRLSLAGSMRVLTGLVQLILGPQICDVITTTNSAGEVIPDINPDAKGGPMFVCAPTAVDPGNVGKTIPTVPTATTVPED